MNKKLINRTSVILLATAVSLPCQKSQAMDDEDPLIALFKADRIEWREDNALAWKGALSVGYDLNKFILISEGARKEGENEDDELNKNSEIRALYSRAITPFWNIQAGMRKEFDPTPTRSWFEIGGEGLAPYFVETTASLLIGEHGRSGLHLEMEKELLLTQNWALIPELELKAFGHNDPETLTGSGLSEAEISLRLHYRIGRKFLPYAGINWHRYFGNSADYREEQNLDTSGTELVAGIRFWF